MIRQETEGPAACGNIKNTLDGEISERINGQTSRVAIKENDAGYKITAYVLLPDSAKMFLKSTQSFTTWHCSGSRPADQLFNTQSMSPIWTSKLIKILSVTTDD